jgi:hypothetical protein
MPGTGLVTVGASTLFGISTVLRAETSDKAFRTNEVRPNTPNMVYCTKVSVLQGSRCITTAYLA